MKKLAIYKNFFLNLIFPAFVFGSITGILTAITVMLYKLLAKYVISLSERGYELIRERLYLIPIALLILFGISFLFAYIYKKLPNARGGGIPTSIGILRGIITFKWLRALLGVFFMSLGSFLIGVPLGNEGPSVQIGTAIGRGSIAPFSKKHKAWDRYSMTGGACAGFSVATGAPVSGIMFAIEEAHQRISPMIVIVSAVSVMFSRITTELLSPILGIDINLFVSLNLPKLQIKDSWLPLLIGVVLGLFAVAFLNYYRLIYNFFNKLLKKVPHQYKIFTVLALTLILGVVSFNYVSTGHHLTETLLQSNKIAIYALILIFVVRSTLTLFSNANGITGGLFLPIMALGAVLSSLIAKCSILLGLNESYYEVILVLGITACISGMMKMPITAIAFAIEALSAHGNILYVVIASTIAYVITEIFRAESINDSVIERKVHDQNKDKEAKVVDTFVTVKKNTFAVGKQIRDIFWPSGLLVLSVKKDEKREGEVDQYGGKALIDTDALHIRYTTYDEAQTIEELYAIVGEQ